MKLKECRVKSDKVGYWYNHNLHSTGHSTKVCECFEWLFAFQRSKTHSTIAQ